MNIERASDAVLASFQRGAKVLDRAAAESLVRLVIIALGIDMSEPTDDTGGGA